MKLSTQKKFYRVGVAVVTVVAVVVSVRAGRVLYEAWSLLDSVEARSNASQVIGLRDVEEGSATAQEGAGASRLEDLSLRDKFAAVLEAVDTGYVLQIEGTREYMDSFLERPLMRILVEELYESHIERSLQESPSKIADDSLAGSELETLNKISELDSEIEVIDLQLEALGVVENVDTVPQGFEEEVVDLLKKKRVVMKKKVDLQVKAGDLSEKWLDVHNRVVKERAEESEARTEFVVELLIQLRTELGLEPLGESSRFSKYR